MIGHTPGQNPRRPMDLPSGDGKCVLGTRTAPPHGHFPSGDAVFVLGTHQTNSLWDTRKHKIEVRQRLMCVARWTHLMRRTYLLLMRDTCPASTLSALGVEHGPSSSHESSCYPSAGTALAASGATCRWPPRCPEVARSRALAIRAAPAPKRARAFRMAQLGEHFFASPQARKKASRLAARDPAVRATGCPASVQEDT